MTEEEVKAKAGEQVWLTTNLGEKEKVKIPSQPEVETDGKDLYVVVNYDLPQDVRRTLVNTKRLSS